MSDRGRTPLRYRRPDRGLGRYERNGWIGLAIALALCVVAYILFHR